MDLMDYRRKIIANSPHLMSASGAVVSFTDGADLPLKSLIVDIDPVQSGTGDPSPTNIRPISGWNAVNVKNGNTVIATISLGQTVYGGTLNPLTGVLTVDRYLYVYDGTESFSKSGTALNGFYNNLALNILPHNWPSMLNYNNDNTPISSEVSSMFRMTRTVNTYKQNYGYCFLDSGMNFNCNPDVFGTTVDTFKAKLAELYANETPVSVFAKLATPIEIQLTPQQVRSLYGNNTIFADTGNVALEYWAHP